jgi:FlaA1/EpsC-like NDP-sugar epimerase
MRQLRIRTLAVMVHDIIVVMAAFYLSVALVNQELLPSIFSKFLPLMQLLGIVVGVQFSIFYFIGIYKAMLRFSSIPDLIRIVKGVAFAVPASFFCLFLINRLENIPRSSIVLDYIFLLIGLNVGRLSYRIMKDSAIRKMKQFSGGTQKINKRTFIIGAGVAGERLLREFSFDTSAPFNVVGFVDDNSQKIGKSIRGVNVFGPVANLPKLIPLHGIQHIIIAMPSASQEEVRRISNLTREFAKDLQVQILPRMADILDGKIYSKALRNIEPGDLLGRKAHNLDIQQMSSMIKDRTILITGAGGSIGSELCKQVATFEPKLLVLFEITELFLYELEMNLKELFPTLQIQAIIGDIRNAKKLDSVFEKFKPSVVFHSAAYKHVPLMQLNPFESIQTNVAGTFNVATAADKHKVDRFVLISTDKAINPTNIMGASKRIAELVCQDIQSTSVTKFLMVRFGNVLGSSGSVVPLFKKQIESGGPITITHPEMRRYFMSIPEATQLVIQAGSLGNQGEIMVLDMGEPMKIKDLAFEMIALSGRVPEVDIKIEYTGLRPGEKLFEELFHEEEAIQPTKHPMVKIAKTRLPQKEFKKYFAELVALPETSTLSAINAAIKPLVPEYSHDPSDSVKKDLVH